MTEAVLDSSAILAVINEEAGAEVALRYLPGAYLSAVNLAEVVTKLVARGEPPDRIAAIVSTLGVRVVAFREGQAVATGELCRIRSVLSLSLGDRACIALARELGLPVVTADHPWTQHDLGLDIRLIR